MISTFNNLRAGDKIEYFLYDSNNAKHIMTGVVMKILSFEKLIFKSDRSHVDITALADDCTKVYECDICQDIGYITISAHQNSGEVIDDEDIPCTCKGEAQFKQQSLF